MNNKSTPALQKSSTKNCEEREMVEKKIKEKPLRLRSEFYLPEHPRYRCCCQWCHVRTGSIIISVICMLLCSYFLIKGIVFVARYPEEYHITSVIAIVAAVICLFISGLLLFGAWKEKPLLLVPYLIVQALVVFVAFAMSIVCFVYLFTGEESLLGTTEAVDHHPQPMASQSEQYVLKLFVVGAIVMYTLVWGLGIWFFIVVVQCFRWMKEKAAHDRNEFYVPLSEGLQG